MPSSVPAAPALPALRVMVVDDHPNAAELLKEMLEMQGHCAVAALDAASALAACEHGVFDLMLLDLSLPDMPGVELARRIRAAAQGRQAPMLVAVSGYGRDASQAAGAAEHFDAFLPKPVDFDALDRLLARCAALHLA